MPIKRLGHVNLRLPDAKITAVRDFYVDVLGFVVGDRPAFESSGYWLYAGEEPIIHLVRDASVAGTEVLPGVVDHFAIECSDYGEMCGRLNAAGIDYRKDVVPDTDCRQLFFSDPAGVGVELIFPK